MSLCLLHGTFLLSEGDEAFCSPDPRGLLRVVTSWSWFGLAFSEARPADLLNCAPVKTQLPGAVLHLPPLLYHASRSELPRHAPEPGPSTPTNRRTAPGTATCHLLTSTFSMPWRSCYQVGQQAKQVEPEDAQQYQPMPGQHFSHRIFPARSNGKQTMALWVGVPEGQLSICTTEASVTQNTGWRKSSSHTKQYGYNRYATAVTSAHPGGLRNVAALLSC